MEVHFEKNNLEIANTDSICNEYIQQKSEMEETSNIKINNENCQLNAFGLLSSLHNEKSYEKLGQRYIDVS